MKTMIKNTLLLLCAVLSLASCDKDGDLAYIEGFGSSDLIATATDVVLTVDNREQVVLSLAWKNPTLLSSDEKQPVAAGQLTTTLQISASEDFSTLSESTTTGLSKAYTGTELNTLAKALGLEADASAPLYFRIKSSEGANIAQAYSNVCAVNVQPFTVDLSYLSVLNGGKDTVLNYLYSPQENGVYTGWMTASAWMNCWFMENDGTVWGNSPVDGHAFELSNEAEAWNIWFGDGTGHWYVTVDTKNAEWSGINVTDLLLNGESMTYNNSDGTYTYVITTTTTDTQIEITASGLEFNKQTGDSKANAEAKTINFVMADGKLTMASAATGTTIAKAGTYTVTVSVNDKAENVYTITEGATKPDEPEIIMPSELKIYNKDGDTVLATLSKTAGGVYKGELVATQWLGFKIVDEENDIWYGCESSDQYSLTSADGSWSMWLNDDFADGATVVITADLNKMKWNYTVK